MARFGVLGLLFVVAQSVVACQSAGPGEVPWSEVAGHADRDGLLFAAEMALLVVPGNLDAATTPEATAVAAAAAAPAVFDPVGCAAATVDGARVVYAFDGCRGSFGLVRVTGTLDVTFRVGPAGSSVFTARAEDVALRGSVVSFDVDASVTRDGGIRTIVAASRSSGTRLDGTAFEREGSVTARWMDSWGCLFVDQATMSSTQLGRSWTTRQEAMTFCTGECPMRGGQTTWTRDDAVSVRLEYAGRPEVTWSVSDGSAPGALAIVCGV